VVRQAFFKGGAFVLQMDFCDRSDDWMGGCSK